MQYVTIAWRIEKITIRIVMGTALSGKTYFIKENFPDSLILSVGEYQRKLMAERKKGLMPLGEYRNILQLANDH